MIVNFKSAVDGGTRQLLYERSGRCWSLTLLPVWPWVNRSENKTVVTAVARKQLVAVPIISIPAL